MRNIIVGCAIVCLAVNVFGSEGRLVVPDDYATVQEAIGAARAGQTVEIRPGVYKGPLTFKNGIRLKGMSRDDVIVRCEAKEGPVVKVADCRTGTITGLTLLQTAADKLREGEKSLLPVLWVQSSSIKVSQCTIRDGGDNGITIEGEGNCEISECSVSKNRRSGIYVYGDGAEPVLKGNRCSENKINGIYFKNGAGGIASENTCDKNGLHGISVVHKWTSPKLKSNVCSGNGGSGIYYGDGAKGEAENNICEENKWHGISIAGGSSAPLLRSNRCVSNKRCGIYYSRKAHITARDNVVKDNGEINFRQLRNVLWAKRFDELEETAFRLRTEKSEFTNGNCQLNHFYYSLGGRWSGYTPSREEWLFGILEEWIEEKPKSITPRIVMARAYVDFAWHARGGDLARDVPEYAWEIFHEKLEKAWEVMTEAEKLQEKDPELYRMFLRAGMGLSEDDEQMNELFEKGEGVGKWYYPLYTQRAIALLPRWGGKVGELEAFASRSAELVGGDQGELLYTRIVASMVSMFHNLGPDRFIELGFSYPRAKQGHIDMLEKYPTATYYLNSYCLLASIYKDKETARGLFERVGDDWDEDVWCKEEHFRNHRSWVYGEVTGGFRRQRNQGKKSRSRFGRILDWLVSAGGED